MERERVAEEILEELEKWGPTSKGELLSVLPAGIDEIEGAFKKLEEEGKIEEENGKLKIIR